MHSTCQTCLCEQKITDRIYIINNISDKICTYSISKVHNLRRKCNLIHGYAVRNRYNNCFRTQVTTGNQFNIINYKFMRTHNTCCSNHIGCRIFGRICRTCQVNINLHSKVTTQSSTTKGKCVYIIVLSTDYTTVSVVREHIKIQ